MINRRLGYIPLVALVRLPGLIVGKYMLFEPLPSLAVILDPPVPIFLTPALESVCACHCLNALRVVVMVVKLRTKHCLDNKSAFGESIPVQAGGKGMIS